jgi:hypothetical protein
LSESDGFFYFAIEIELIEPIYHKETNDTAFRITDKGRIMRDFLNMLEPKQEEDNSKKTIDRKNEIQENRSIEE